MSLLKKLLHPTLSFAFQLLDGLGWKKCTIVFACRNGLAYADNSQVLFEHFIECGDENAYFFTREKGILSAIPKNGIYAYSWKGMITLLRAKVLVFTHGTADFSPFNPGKRSGRVFVNLFHAIAVKEVGHGGDPKKLKEIAKWDHFIVSSEFEAKTVMRQFSLGADKTKVLGQPRNDILCGHHSDNSAKQTRKILYAPTFRENATTVIFPFPDKDLQKLDDHLAQVNMKVVVRLHINEERRVRENKAFERFKCIELMNSNNVPSVNEVLAEFDGVITDYSSVTMDYLLLDRPIGYILYDLEEYQKNRGFSFDFEEHMAGPEIRTQEELLAFTNLNLDEFQSKRQYLKMLFHQYQDGRSAERIRDLINNL